MADALLSPDAISIIGVGVDVTVIPLSTSTAGIATPLLVGAGALSATTDVDGEGDADSVDDGDSDTPADVAVVADSTVAPSDTAVALAGPASLVVPFTGSDVVSLSGAVGAVVVVVVVVDGCVVGVGARGGGVGTTNPVGASSVTSGTPRAFLVPASGGAGSPNSFTSLSVQ